MTARLFSLDGALFAEFDDPDGATAAVTELRERGYAKLESYSAFPLNPQLPRRGGVWLSLAIFTFAAAVLGGIAGYLVQWYTNAASYPLDIGGRPTHAAPAFVYPTIEAIILVAGLTIFVGLFAGLRLPRLWRPELEIDEFERVSDDRFWVSVGLGSGGGDLHRTTRELVDLGARRVVHVLGEP